MFQLKSFTKTNQQNTLLPKPMVQTKLEVGQPADKYEREADVMADHVISNPRNDRNMQIACSSCKEEELQMKTYWQPNFQMQTTQKIDKPMIQKQEEETSISPDAENVVPGVCHMNPVFPDFNCFMIHIKRNIDTNLYNNAHHFMRIASLYPDNSAMMEYAFMRYGLGLNILETSYQFLGADAGLATGLAYGTGIGLKAFDFFSNGELMLDFQIDLTDDVNLDLQLDLNANPDDLSDIQGASAGVGVSGHF